MEEQSYWPRSQFDNEKLNWPPDESLLELDFRWPSLGLVKEYRDAREKLSGLVALGKELQWPAILAAFLKQRLQHGLGATPSSDFETVRWTLRKTGTLGAMLMHLKPTELVSLGVALTNARRNRTPYSTYPTSPFIARAAAHYVWSVLSGDHLPKSTRIHILDPTMEGGPFLLELAFLAPIAQRLRRSWTATQPQIIVHGVDQNSISVALVSTLLKEWRRRSKPNCIEFNLQCADALEWLKSCDPLDAIVNNPPWGARTDGAASRPLSGLGPYVGYRDPYIAVVSLGIRRLKPGHPFAFVLPFQLLTASSAAGLREELLENALLDHIVTLPRKAFPRATVKTVMILGRRRQKGESQHQMQVVRYPFEERMSQRSVPVIAPVRPLVVQGLDARPWMDVIQSDPSDSLVQETVRLGQITDILLGIEPYRIGRGNPKQTRAIVDTQPYTFSHGQEGAVPVARSKDIERFGAIRPSEFVSHGPWLAARGRNVQVAGMPRVFVRQICARDGSLVASIAPKGVVARYGVFTIVCKRISTGALCALLNSALTAQYVRQWCASYHKESFNRITINDLRNMPVPVTLVAQPGRSSALSDKLSRKARNAISLARQQRHSIRARAEEEIEALVSQAFESGAR